MFVFVAGFCFQLWWALAAFHNGHLFSTGFSIEGSGFSIPHNPCPGPLFVAANRNVCWLHWLIGCQDSWWRLLMPPKNLRLALPVSHTGQYVSVVLTHHVYLHLHGQLGTSAWVGCVFALRMPLKGLNLLGAGGLLWLWVTLNTCRS